MSITQSSISQKDANTHIQPRGRGKGETWVREGASFQYCCFVSYFLVSFFLKLVDCVALRKWQNRALKVPSRRVLYMQIVRGGERERYVAIHQKLREVTRN